MFEDIKVFLVETLDLDADDIKIDSSLADDLGIDSLDAVELVLELQDRYEVKVDEQQAQAFKTVQDIVSFLESQK